PERVETKINPRLFLVPPVARETSNPCNFSRARRGRPRSRRAAEQRDEVAAYHLGHGACSPRFAPTKAMAVRLVCRPSRVSRSGRQVLGQHLKCSESRGGWEGGFICRAQSGG